MSQELDRVTRVSVLLTEQEMSTITLALYDREDRLGERLEERQKIEECEQARAAIRRGLNHFLPPDPDAC